jgi:hypothetical protein
MTWRRESPPRPPTTRFRRVWSAAAGVIGAQAANECITKVSGLDTFGPQVIRQENTSLLTQMIADLEARLAEPAAG